MFWNISSVTCPKSAARFRSKYQKTSSIAQNQLPWHIIDFILKSYSDACFPVKPQHRSSFVHWLRRSSARSSSAPFSNYDLLQLRFHFIPAKQVSSVFQLQSSSAPFSIDSSSPNNSVHGAGNYMTSHLDTIRELSPTERSPNPSWKDLVIPFEQFSFAIDGVICSRDSSWNVALIPHEKTSWFLSTYY